MYCHITIIRRLISEMYLSLVTVAMYCYCNVLVITAGMYCSLVTAAMYWYIHVLICITRSELTIIIIIDGIHHSLVIAAYVGSTIKDI